MPNYLYYKIIDITKGFQTVILHFFQNINTNKEPGMIHIHVNTIITAVSSAFGSLVGTCIGSLIYLNNNHPINLYPLYEVNIGATFGSSIGAASGDAIGSYMNGDTAKSYKPFGIINTALEGGIGTSIGAIIGEALGSHFGDNAAYYGMGIGSTLGSAAGIIYTELKNGTTEDIELQGDVAISDVT
jgi:hypothetical protein